MNKTQESIIAYLNLKEKNKSLNQIHAHTGISEERLLKAIHELEKMSLIEVKLSPRGRIVGVYLID